MASFDFNKVPKPKAKPADPDWSNPLSFFYKLSHPDILNLFPAQNDILKNWFADFKGDANDKMVALNTGGGKTLIGLMIAESVRRETGGKVVYICPNNFLGKQTVDEARKYGLHVASYLRINSDRPIWRNETDFLQNNAVCVTTYPALLNPRSIFKNMEIKGVIFDDAHLSLDLLDDQFSLRVDDAAVIKSITDIFKSSAHIKDKIESIQDGDPLALVMIPPIEWHQQAETIKGILNGHEPVRDSLSWINLKEKLNRTFCFISANRLEMGFLYPDIKHHFVFHKSVHRVYLSATLPNLDDLTRVFGITPTRIDVDNPDYRPQRLFVFAKKTSLSKPEDVIRANLRDLSPKTLVLTPSGNAIAPYRTMGALIPTNSDDVPAKIEEFKKATTGILALANRYDGIDLPGKTCHSLVIDDLPYTGNLKTRFFSEYFHNHRNAFLRSITASKLIQAFGRTIRANDDYSVIFILGAKLNSWIINKDNKKFFKPDLYEDIEIGLDVSESIATLDDLKKLSSEILGQSEDWKTFFEERKAGVGPAESLSRQDEEKNVQVAQKERKIHDAFMSGDYRACLELILEAENELSQYSKPILGLYLSMAAICCLETDDARAVQLSGHAYGINPIFGSPVKPGVRLISLQAQRIIDFRGNPPTFDWSLRGTTFDENLKNLGTALGFSARRPEAEGDGTLDVCWEDEEKKIVIGFENKMEKTNKILAKHDIDQCSGHFNWLRDHYVGYKQSLFAVGEFEGYHGLSSPSNLLYTNLAAIQKVAVVVPQIHAKKLLPEQIDPSLDSEHLRIEELFPENRVSDLPKVSFGR